MSFINQYTDEMINLKQEAERANEAKSVFLAHMSHDNILQQIIPLFPIQSWKYPKSHL